MLLLPGDDPRRGPLNAQAWNRVYSAADRYHTRQATGEGGAPKLGVVKLDRVTVKNNTGADRSRGDVVELGSYLLNDAEVDSEAFWFNGDTPSLAANSIGFGVLLYAAPQDAFTEVLLIGVCKATVNISNADHEYAITANNSHQLVSAVSGPVRILHKPTGTGVKECAVLLGEKGPTQLIGKATEAIAVGGSGTCLVYRGIPGSEADTGLDVEAFNRTTDIEAEEWISLTLVDDRYWYVAPLGCPAEE